MAKNAQMANLTFIEKVSQARKDYELEKADAALADRMSERIKEILENNNLPVTNFVQKYLQIPESSWSALETYADKIKNREIPFYVHGEEEMATGTYALLSKPLKFKLDISAYDTACDIQIRKFYDLLKSCMESVQRRTALRAKFAENFKKMTEDGKHHSAVKLYQELKLFDYKVKNTPSAGRREDSYRIVVENPNNPLNYIFTYDRPKAGDQEAQPAPSGAQPEVEQLQSPHRNVRFRTAVKRRSQRVKVHVQARDQDEGYEDDDAIDNLDLEAYDAQRQKARKVPPSRKRGIRIKQEVLEKRARSEDSHEVIQIDGEQEPEEIYESEEDYNEEDTLKDELNFMYDKLNLKLNQTFSAVVGTSSHWTRETLEELKAYDFENFFDAIQKVMYDTSRRRSSEWR
ncbi:hypothetical protein L596_016814 [Steinernema carpocapsae]|uniref:Uncharacterized protein n=1 Tax=Steinernema carpocapsae TaxID=34508 RepID=A0A4U5NK55_STECR|nr:hypothetical protein L596_016814 [Steinernema carpocapsae]